MGKKLGPGGAADSVTRSFLTNCHGKTGRKMGFYCTKFFFPRFCVSTTMLQVKRREDQLDKVCEGKKGKKTGFQVLAAVFPKISILLGCYTLPVGKALGSQTKVLRFIETQVTIYQSSRRSFSVQKIQTQMVGKGEVVPIRTLKTHGGNRDIATLILNLGSRWRSVYNFTPRQLYLWERTAVLSINRGKIFKYIFKEWARQLSRYSD